MLVAAAPFAGCDGERSNKTAPGGGGGAVISGDDGRGGDGLGGADDRNELAFGVVAIKTAPARAPGYAGDIDAQPIARARAAPLEGANGDCPIRHSGELSCDCLRDACATNAGDPYGGYAQFGPSDG